MLPHPELHLLVVSPPGEAPLPLWQRLERDLPHVTMHHASELPGTLAPYDGVITVAQMTRSVAEARLRSHVEQGGCWLAMLQLCQEPLPGLFGVQGTSAGPRTELRVLFQDPGQPVAARLPDAVYVDGCFQPLQTVAADVEILLYCDYHYTHQPVWTTRLVGEGMASCTSLQDFSEPMLRQLLHRIFRQCRNTAPAPQASMGVGILGYAPSVGQKHGLAVAGVDGLELKTICDLNPGRLEQARLDFPDVTVTPDSGNLAEDPEVDLVIVATAPHVHSSLSIDMMRGGKHVLCEKPLALTRQQCDRMLEAASRYRVHLSCHQNRRWDPDYRAIRDCVENGRLGHVFHLEAFVGGFHHPCGYWHSHDEISGGTAYDWGAHYLDWIVSLMPGSVERVWGSRHKRVWHDVTNADQERIMIRLSDGREAEFIHSDIAAARKPKWYLLGTRAALVGSWVDVSAHEADSIYYFRKTDIPATEMMPEITLFTPLKNGATEQTRLALPDRDPFGFHRNLADHLLWGEPLAAPLADSLTVVSILEAAARSMARGGGWEAVDGD